MILHWHIEICHVSFGPQDKDKSPIQSLWLIIFIKIKKKDKFSIQNWWIIIFIKINNLKRDKTQKSQTASSTQGAGKDVASLIIEMLS